MDREFSVIRPFVSWYSKGVFIIDKSRKASVNVAKFIDCEDADGKTWLMNLFTESECRRRGIATRLIEAAKIYCNKHNVEALYLWCEKELIPFYEKRGFENIHQMKISASGLPMYIMVCPIKKR